MERSLGEAAHEIPNQKPVKTEVHKSLKVGNHSFQGTPVGKGYARGRLCIANCFEDAKVLEPGSILLTKTPNPALVPLYPTIKGLITASGGQLSHGFVAAREYGIPAITHSKYDELKEFIGHEILIDGGSGQISVIDDRSH